MKNTKRFLNLILLFVMMLSLSVWAKTAPKLNKHEMTLIKGQTFQMKTTGTKERPKWSSDDKSIAVISKNGLVKAKAKGKTAVFAKFKDHTLFAVITVETPKLSKTKATVKVGKKLTLKLKGNSQKVKWSSSNAKIAKVSQKGVVVGKKVGTAKITAKVGNKRYVCKVTVKENSSSATPSGEGGTVAPSSGDGGSSDSGSSDAGAASGGDVWIPRTGSKYHSSPTCSNMRNPSQVSRSEAVARGYEPCSKCWVSGF